MPRPSATQVMNIVELRARTNTAVASLMVAVMALGVSMEQLGDPATPEEHAILEAALLAIALFALSYFLSGWLMLQQIQHRPALLGKLVSAQPARGPILAPSWKWVYDHSLNPGRALRFSQWLDLLPTRFLWAGFLIILVGLVKSLAL